MTSQESLRLSVERCNQSLVHACQCRDANCRLPCCHKMNRVVQHAKSCKRKINGGCPICKQLIALCCYHAKHCQEANCPVLFCLNLKRKLRQQQLRQTMQMVQTLGRRMVRLANRGHPRSLPQSNPRNSNFSSEPSPSAPPHTSPNPPQPGIGMAGQMPGVPGQILQGIGGLSSRDGSGYIPEGILGRPRQPPQPQQTGLFEPNQSIGPGDASNTLGNPSPPMGRSQGLLGPGPAQSATRRIQVLQQLLQTLKSPTSPQQQEQVLQILKSSPQLMAAFIRQRAAKQQQAQ